MIMIKVFHLFFLYLWLAHLFVLPACLREKMTACYRLYKRVELPCMILALSLGVVLLLMMPHKLKNGLFHLKLTAVLGLVGCDIWVGRTSYLFATKSLMPSRRATFVMQGIIAGLLFVILCAILLGKNTTQPV